MTLLITVLKASVAESKRKEENINKCLQDIKNSCDEDFVAGEVKAKFNFEVSRVLAVT